MSAFLTLAVVLVCAAGAGWLVYRGLSSVRSRAARWAWSIVPAFFVLPRGSPSFVRAIFIPPSDDSMFSGRLTFELAFTGGHGHASVEEEYPAHG